MNVTFHVLSAVGATAVLSSRQKDWESRKSPASFSLPGLAGALIAGVLLHGVLDWIPHSYPINSVVDVGASLALLAVAMALVRQRHRLPLSMCALGSLLPDLVDLGPAIINKRLGWSLPVFKFFPWHWPQFSGSIYDGSRGFTSLSCHLLVVTASLAMLYLYRDSLFAELPVASGP